MPAWLGLLGWWLLAVLFVWALCRAANMADGALEADEEPGELIEVGHFGEHRSRRDRRNGLGGTGGRAA